jgi:DNA-binding SARP family transcriptional activator
MEIRMLGPVEVWAAGRQLKAGSRRQRTVLAVLAIDPSRPVTVDTLVDRVWDDAPPARPRDSLYVYLARLRTLLRHASAGNGSPATLVHTGRAYRLDLDPRCVDVYQFRSLQDDSRRPDCSDERRATLLRQALRLWRDMPLADLTSAWAERVRAGLLQQHLDVTTRWAQAELSRRNQAPVIETLTHVIHEQPFAERLVAVLMRALYAAGRTADALEMYQQTRARLVEQLGVEPGPELQQVHRSILRAEPVGQAAEALAVHQPAQLPPDVPGFAGRTDELSKLDELLAAKHEQPTAVVVSAVSGMACVGKTALAVHWAHTVSHQFPDGQLYADLRGFDSAGDPVPAAEIVRGFLTAFGVTGEQVPARFDEQVGLYRSLLAGRRVLVLLDNARDAEQVRALLPGAPGCLVLVTSRDQLAGLATGLGAHVLTLPPMTAAQARELLAGRLGEPRISAEPQAVDGIIAGCGGLPLALSIVAARASAHPRFPLTALAAEVAARLADGLDLFAGGDSITDLRTAFSWSYRALDPHTARLFRLLSIHPGPEITVTAAASLAGIPVSKSRRHLAELARANLVAENRPQRFTLHILLRSYAAELAGLHPEFA